MFQKTSLALALTCCAALVLAPAFGHAKGKSAKKALAPVEEPAEQDDTEKDEKPKTEGDDAPADEADAKPEDEAPAEDTTENTVEGVTEESTSTDEAPAPPPEEEPFARLWVGVSGVVDIAFLPSGRDLCRLNPDGTIMNSIHVFCTDPEGRDFPQRSNALQNQLLSLNGAGTMNGGPALGDVRFLLAADYAITQSVLLGGRLGYVANSYQGRAGLGGRPALTRHLHAELRATYLFGDAPLSRVGFSPLAFFAAGFGQFDAHERTNIRYNNIRASDPVEAWAVSGPLFVTLGGGARYQFSRRAAFSAAARGNVSFGPQGTLLTAGPEVTFLYGF